MDKFPKWVFLLLTISLVEVEINGYLERHMFLSLSSCEMDSTGKICTIRNMNGDFFIGNANDMTTVTDIILKDSLLDKVPTKTLDKFSSLRKIDISKNNFTELSFAAMRTSLASLIILDASSNNITKLSSDTFEKTTGLKELYLSRNGIETLPSTVFFNLPQLMTLDLSHNNIKSIAQDNMFGFLRSLRFIYLNHNGITRLRTSFGNVSNLIEFDGSHNDLKDWSLTFASGSTVKLNLAYCGLRNSYSSAADKEELNLEGNMIEIMKITGKVTRLRANNNIIRQVEIDPTIHLEALELANNYISDISNISKVEYLQVLDLSGNKLKSSLKGKILSDLTALTYLSLANTGLTMTNELLEDNTRLLYLDISNNRLGNFDLKMLKQLGNLEILKLDSNEIGELVGHEDVKEFLPELSTIGLSNNMFSCSYLQKMLKAFKDSLVEVSVPMATMEAVLPNIKGVKCINDGKNISDQLIYTDNLMSFQDESFKDDVRAKMRSIQDDIGLQKQSLNTHEIQLQDVHNKLKDSIKELMTATQNQLTSLTNSSGANKDVLGKLQELSENLKKLNQVTADKLDDLSGNANQTSRVDKLVMDTQVELQGLQSEAKTVLVMSVFLVLMILVLSAFLVKDKFQNRFRASRSYSEQQLTL